MGRYLLAMTLVAGLMFAWLAVQHLARAFARRHPQFGPVREEGAGCGGSACRCAGGGSCRREDGEGAAGH